MSQSRTPESTMASALEDTLKATLGPVSYVEQKTTLGLDSDSPLATLPIGKPARLNIHPDVEENTSAQRFVVNTVLGEGMSGRVWSATDTDLHREVAIKHFRHSDASQGTSISRELRTLAQINHPRVPTIFDVDLADDDSPYIIMEQMKGRTLRDWIEDLKAGDAQAHAYADFYQRIDWIRQLLRLLAVVHAKGMIHRDIKPSNIMISPEGELYLIDWGLATLLDEDDGEGILVGTPLFMAPEQARREALDVRADVYSVAAVAYELLGLVEKQPPEPSIEEHLEKLQTYKVKNLYRVVNALQTNVPIEFVYPIMNALKISRDDRTPSADAFLKELDDALNGCYDLVCFRSFLKGSLTRLAQWLDGSYKAVLLGYSIILSFVSLAGLGVYTLLNP